MELLKSFGWTLLILFGIALFLCVMAGLAAAAAWTGHPIACLCALLFCMAAYIVHNIRTATGGTGFPGC